MAWLGLMTLMVLELVLGIDNLVFNHGRQRPPAARPYLCDPLVLHIADAPWLAGEHLLDVKRLNVRSYTTLGRSRPVTTGRKRPKAASEFRGLAPLAVAL